MGKKFYIADTHFGHENMIKFDKRPFSNVQEMDTIMVENWNRVVGKDDTVYILGDFLWQHSEEYVELAKSLNGHKRLIKGNHDRSHNSSYKKIFEAINDYEEVQDAGMKIILSHYPMMAYNGSYNGRALHLYGHVHTTNEADRVNEMIKQFSTEEFPMVMKNVGCMMPYMDYTPRTILEIFYEIVLTSDGN